MAKQHGKTKFTGRLGDLVGIQTRKGDFFVRSHYQIPKEVWENDPRREPNRRAARNFGDDSQFVTHIRHSLKQYLPLMADSRLHNRLQSLVSQARVHCMRADPRAPLDISKIAPAFRRFSLRNDLILNEVAIFQPTWTTQQSRSRTLTIPKIETGNPKWSRNNVEILRWHVALIPLRTTAADAHAFPSQFLESPWMPINSISDQEFPLNIPENTPPILVAVGLEPAQGTPDCYFPLRTLAVMEILEII